jgi:phosphonate transport system substrate-binding protein
MYNITISTIQAPNSEAICLEIANYAARRIGMEATFVADVDWQTRELMLHSADVDVCWVCGLPYVVKVDELMLDIELLAAPVMRGARYGGEPIYYSDVIVRADSSFRRFTDLRGCRWAFNESGSQSGYGVVRYHLATLGERSGYFGDVIETGGHLRSLAMILSGEIDATAIDSTVLELELARDPALGPKLRVVEVMGPSPIPPWVINRRVPPPIRDALRQAFLTMHDDPQGRLILASGLMDRFVAVDDSDYDAIREMDRESDDVVLGIG